MAYSYVAKHYPRGAPLELIGKADARVLEAQEREDWEGYIEGLRELMRIARREAIKRKRVA